jgi:hypothetical protein
MRAVHDDEGLHGRNRLAAIIAVSAARRRVLQDPLGDATPGLMLLPKRVDQIGELSRLSKPREDEDEVLFRFLMIVLDDVADDIGGI